MLALFVYFDFYHFTSVYSTQLVRFLLYLFWRSCDGFFFFVTQFCIFSFALIVKLGGFFIRLFVARNAQSSVTPGSNVCAPSYLPQTELITSARDFGVANAQLADLFETSREACTLSRSSLIGVSRKLYLFLFALRTDTLSPLYGSNFGGRSSFALRSVNQPFTLEYLIPQSIYLTRRITPSTSTTNLPFMFSGTVTPLTTSSVFLTNASTINTLRWTSKYASAFSKDLVYLRSLPASLYSSSPELNNLFPHLSLFCARSIVVPSKALEWANFRINLLTQSTSAVTLPGRLELPTVFSFNSTGLATLAHLLMCRNPRENSSWYQTSLIFICDNKFFILDSFMDLSVQSKQLVAVSTKSTIYSNRR